MARVIADLHIHSKYSRATSDKMELKEIARFARIKGLKLVGTGDFTHPKWFQEIKKNLIESPGTGLYRLLDNPQNPVCFMITVEASTIFTFEGNLKKIHHIVLVPNLDVATQVRECLARYGDLAVDGRPTLDMTAPQFVEEIMSVSNDNVVIPAHAWTPWFGLFGAFSGFDHIEDCYKDTIKHIHAIETGLSSDPPMNRRLSCLDRFVLVSNSDSHSSWPWRIGREANVFELKKLTYYEVIDTIRRKDPKRFKFTIETDPKYGKYHWTGHRNCRVSLSPRDAISIGNRCPVCRKKLTKGVDQRVEELADRPAVMKRKSEIGYMYLLPLSEIIATVLEVTYPGAQKVWKIYNSLVSKFGNEYTVLMNAPMEEIASMVEPKIAEVILQVRENNIEIVPGYDGVYGTINIFGDQTKKRKFGTHKQQSIANYM